MHKLFRSLLAVGALTAFAACGDDVSITPPPPEGVTISGAPSTAIKVGDVVQLSANVPVTWTSAATNVASVDGTGRVTAIAAGVASITATSQEDATKSASVSITVTGSIAPTVSISAITTGATNVPVNPNNVAGQINVVVNMDPGDFTVQRLELLVDDQVVDQQDFGTSVQASAAVAVDGEPANQVQQVVFSLNTGEFDQADGSATYPNGSHTIGARVVVTGGGSSGAAAPTKQLMFNNAPGLFLTFSNDNGSDPASATNGSTGFAYMGGSVTLGVVGVSYNDQQTFSSASITLFGIPQTIALTNNVGSVTYSESQTWNGTQARIGNYLSAGNETPVVTATVLNGAAGPTTVLNGSNGIPAFPTVRIDNTGPGAASANGVAQNAITTATVVLWVNAASAFSAGNLGIPSQSTLNSADIGASGVVVEVFVTSNGGTLPAQACSVTGLTQVSTGADLAETTVSSAYRARVRYKDALGNTSCTDLSGGSQFGADFTAPTGQVTAGPTANTGYNAGLPSWAVTAADNASGFSLTPLNVIMTRLNPDGSTDCEIGSGSSCGNPQQRALTFDATDGTNAEGYYTTSITLADQAGNTVELVASRVYLLDVTAPAFSGGISLPQLIAGAQTNTFSTAVTDNMDLGSVYGDVTYPVAVLRYPAQAIGTFGPALETSSPVDYAVSDWIRCLNNTGDFTTLTNRPTTITMTVVDQTTQPATNPTSLASGAFGANAEVCTGSVGNIAAADINSFGGDAVDYGGTNVNVDIDGQNVANNSATSVTLTAVADVALNSSADPFTRVDWYYQSGGVWIKIGTSTAQLQQTQTTRTYTYTLVWDPDSAVPVGAVNLIAIGVDAEGDAVGSAGVAVTTVQ